MEKMPRYGVDYDESKVLRFDSFGLSVTKVVGLNVGLNVVLNVVLNEKVGAGVRTVEL